VPHRGPNLLDAHRAVGRHLAARLIGDGHRPGDARELLGADGDALGRDAAVAVALARVQRRAQQAVAAGEVVREECDAAAIGLGVRRRVQRKRVRLAVAERGRLQHAVGGQRAAADLGRLRGAVLPSEPGPRARTRAARQDACGWDWLCAHACAAAPRWDVYWPTCQQRAAVCWLTLRDVYSSPACTHDSMVCQHVWTSAHRAHQN